MDLHRCTRQLNGLKDEDAGRANKLAKRITRGPSAGDQAEVDPISPGAVVPELDEKLFNLEFIQATMNRKKGAEIGHRQIALAEKLHAGGLLSDAGASTFNSDR